MWIEQICGKDVAEMQLKSYEKGFNEFQEVEPILCECGEHKAKFKLVDEFNNKLNLCPLCLEEQELEYKADGFKYNVSLIK